MTLSKDRPRRTYDRQWIIEETDLHGLMKDLDAMVDRYGEAGLIDALYVEGAADAIAILCADGGVDTRLDFVHELKKRMEGRRNDPWE